MLKIANLSKSYAAQELFSDVSFNINARERVGLVGRNGHGKTTLFRLILGLETPDSGTITAPKNYRLGYLEQHIGFTADTVIDEASKGLPETQKYDVWRAEKILFGLGFNQEDMTRHPDEFSGGFQVRLNLVKVLISAPDLLLLDEPTNYLDIVSIRWLAQFLRSWPGELMLITHDRSFMDSVTTHTVAIHRKKARKVEGGTDKLYDQIAQDEEVYERTRLKDERRRKEVEQYIRRFRAKARLANLVQSRIKTLAKQERRHKLEKIETLDFSFQSAPFAAKVMMEAEDVTFGYETDKVLFEDLDLTVAPDDRICIVGKNGKGKTTLLKVLAGKLDPTRGNLRLHPKLQVGYYEQTNTAHLDPKRTIEDELMNTAPDCTQQKARDIAGAMMFSGDMALKKISVLSGGEKARLLLGKMLLEPSHLLLLDEPTNHLDMESCDSMLAALDNFEGAVVMVTHSEMLLRSLATRLIVFDRDKVFLFEGSYDDFLSELGWMADEEQVTRQTGANQALEIAEPVSEKAVDKKALRRKRADIIQEKSQTLKPLESEMRKLESDIEATESEHSRNNQLLIEASNNGDGAKISELAMQESELQAKIEKLYGQLESVTEEFEARSDDFEVRLKELDL